MDNNRLTRVLRCNRCGSILQTVDKNKEGFVETSALESFSGENDILYCSSCLETISALNKSIIDENEDNSILKILDDARATDAFLIWVIDLFSLDSSFSQKIIDKIKLLNIAIICTKYDLLKPFIKLEEIEKYLIERLEFYSIKPKYIKIVSNIEKQSNDLDLFYRKLIKEYSWNDVYVIGSITSGKTSLINQMLKNFRNKSQRLIRQFEYPGTDIKVLEIPLSNSFFIYEIPGFSLSRSVLSKVELSVQKMLIPKKELKIHEHKIKDNESIQVGSIAALSLIDGKKTKINFYSSEFIDSYIVSTKQLQARMCNNYLDKKLKPSSNRLKSFNDYDVFDYICDKNSTYIDISISGLGWFTFKQNGQIIRLTVPKNTQISVERSKFYVK